MKDPALINIEINALTNQLDETLEDWALYRKELDGFLVRVAENAGEEMLIKSGLDGTVNERALLTRASRLRKKIERLTKQYERLVASQAAKTVNLEQKVWPDFGMNVIEGEKPEKSPKLFSQDIIR